MPRLYRFREKHADIDIRLSTTTKLADFVNDGIDIAIRYGLGRYPGLTAELLMREELAPVCSPALLEGAHPLKSPADLQHHTLIHDDFQIDWTMWLSSAGVKGVDAHRGPRFKSSVHAVQAAVQGEGVVLGRSALVADDLKAGRLVKPFTLSLSRTSPITSSSRLLGAAAQDTGVQGLAIRRNRAEGGGAGCGVKGSRIKCTVMSGRRPVGK